MNLPLGNQLALVTGSSCGIGEVSVADHSTGSISDYFAIQTSEWEVVGLVPSRWVVIMVPTPPSAVPLKNVVELAR
jgi:hypothetical protein